MHCLTSRSLTILFTVLVGSCWVTPVYGQVQPVRFQTPRLALLWNEAVQKELKLSDEQRQKIKAALDEMFEDAPDGQKRMKMPATGFHPSPEEFEKLDQRLEKLMKADQVKRWNELHLQQLGYRALALPHIAKELKLSNAQETKVDECMEEYQRKIREKYKAHQRVTQDMIAELDKEFAHAVAPLLTQEQQKKWEALQGAKFTFNKRAAPKKDKE